MDSIDKLLAEVQAEYEKPKTSKQPQKQPQKPSETQKARSHSFKSDRGFDDLLSQVQSEFEEVDRRQEQKRAEQLKQEAIEQEQIRKQKQAKLTKQATEWLKNLDSLSDEGFWFEQFAEKYPTRLEAAIAYLDAILSNSNSK